MSNQRIDTTEDDLQQWIDALLTSEEARPRAPAALHEEVQHLLSRKRRDALAWKSAAVVAAAAAMAAVLLWPQGKPVSVDPQVVSAQKNVPAATFVGRGDMIVVPIESTSPNVTIVKVYPTLSAQKRWRREALVRSLRQRLHSIGDKS